MLVKSRGVSGSFRELVVCVGGAGFWRRTLGRRRASSSTAQRYRFLLSFPIAAYRPLFSMTSSPPPLRIGIVGGGSYLSLSSLRPRAHADQTTAGDPRYRRARHGARPPAGQRRGSQHPSRYLRDGCASTISSRATGTVFIDAPCCSRRSRSLELGCRLGRTRFGKCISTFFNRGGEKS